MWRLRAASPPFRHSVANLKLKIKSKKHFETRCFFFSSHFDLFFLLDKTCFEMGRGVSLLTFLNLLVGNKVTSVHKLLLLKGKVIRDPKWNTLA